MGIMNCFAYWRSAGDILEVCFTCAAWDGLAALMAALALTAFPAVFFGVTDALDDIRAEFGLTRKFKELNHTSPETGRRH